MIDTLPCCFRLLPLQLTETMTDYEQLCKVTKTLNDVIEIVNELDNAITRNNLNVIPFDNVESLKNSKFLVEGNYVVTKGYYTPSDGGNASYVISKTSTGNLLSIPLANGLFAVLITGNRLNVLQLGVQQNAGAQQAIVQAIIDGFKAKELFFPRGVYNFTNGFKVNNRHDITGEITNPSESDNTLNGTIFKFTGVSPNSILVDVRTDTFRNQVSNIYITCDAVEITVDRTKIGVGTAPFKWFAKTVRSEGITALSVGNFGSTIKNVIVRGCQIGMNVGTYNLVESCTAIQCEVGFSVGNDNRFTDLQARECENFIKGYGSLNQYVNLRSDNIELFAVDITGGANSFVNCSFDYTGYGAFSLSGGDNNQIRGVIGRVGYSYYKVDPSTMSDIDKSRACYVFMTNNSNDNLIDINVTKRGLDGTTDAVTPIYAIVTNYTQQNTFRFSGNRTTAYDVDVSLDDIKELFCILGNAQLYGYCEYKGQNFVFKQLTAEYNTSSITKSGLILFDRFPVTRSADNIINVNGRLHEVKAILLNDGAAESKSIEVKQNATAVQFSIPSDPSIGGPRLTGIRTTTVANDAATKEYVDSKIPPTT